MSEAGRIVDVGAKDRTERSATAGCVITMTPQACAELLKGTPKGDPIEAAKVAGLMGIKRTPDLLPFCHPIQITGAEVRIDPDVTTGQIQVRVTVRANDRTGVEMEALTAVAVGALALIDMVKAVDKHARITDVHVTAKSGGRSGDWVEP